MKKVKTITFKDKKPLIPAQTQKIAVLTNILEQEICQYQTQNR